MTRPPPKSARYVQVRELLEQAAQFHGRMAEFYHGLSDRARKDRVKLLLDYMSTHEKNLRDSLDDFDDEASEGVLNTWVDRDHCDRIVHACENLPAPPELSIDGVTTLAMHVDATLIRFYEELARKADVEDVRAVFRNLVAQEQAELRRLARDALMVGDF
jgi:rubrerythrin